MRFSILGIPTNVLELMVGILFIVWMIKGGFKKFRELLITNYSLLIAVLLILIGVTIATIFSWDLRTSAGIWKSWFVVPLVFFIILITTLKPKQIKGVFWAFILSAFIMGVISLIQWNFDGMGRLRGIYTSPNYLAMYLAPALILSLGLFFIERKEILRILLITNYLLLITILFFTKSVGAWLGIVVALIFGLVLYLRKFNKKKLIWFIVILGLIIILAISCLKIFSEQGRISFNARLIIWDMAWYVFEARPIIGIGPGIFEGYFPVYPAWGVPQPHNIYLAFLLQTGLIGFIGFAWLLIWFFRTGFKLIISHWSLAIIIMSVMSYILVHGLVDTTYWKNDLSVMFWVIIGLMVILRKNLDIKSLGFD